ncbi:MAG TPA: addiction module protein [Candidatus Baltobacteraceae bacterium]|nr:addiction module protein [Candidatus Baltobacteraceae bacterium]
MEATLPLDKMTVAEKLRAREMLWADLSRNEVQIESPAWHGDVLRDREARIKSGEEKFLDFETVKKQLRDKLA